MSPADPTERIGAKQPPAAHSSISREMAQELLAHQHPDLASLPLGDRFDGWDMVTFRLGSTLMLRLPRVEAAVASLNTELKWLPQLSPAWDFPCPHIERIGAPQGDYPWPWAIVSWVPGETTDSTPLAADAGAAVGRALAQVHRPAPDDAPYNKEQSFAMADRADDVAWALNVLADARGPEGEAIDVAAASALWELAMAAPSPTERVWGHADTHGSNVLGIEGAFAGIIDWGKMAACDRAVDLGFLYTLMPADGVKDAFAAYREARGCDDAGLEDRARGIALHKCLLWATLDRPVNVTMAWRGLNSLGVTH